MRNEASAPISNEPAVTETFASRAPLDRNLELKDLPQPILLHIFRLIGPKCARASLGRTCRSLREISSLDFLWTQFWMDRCHPERYQHRAGDQWRTEPMPSLSPTMTKEPDDAQGSAGTAGGVLKKYVEMHSRRPPQPTRLVEDPEDPSVTRETAMNCTYEFRTRMTPPGWMEVCGGPASVWCDFDGCENVRCNSNNCPESHGMCLDGDNGPMRFHHCSYCGTTACSKHADLHNWPKPCTKCKVTSCADCVSETLVSNTTMQCQYISSWGLECHETLCTNCTDVVCVENIRALNLKITEVTKAKMCHAAAIAEQHSADDIMRRHSWRDLDALICCRECADKLGDDVRHLFQMEQERLEELDNFTPCPRVTRRRIMKRGNNNLRAIGWAFGSFKLVDVDGQMRGGKLSLGVNRSGRVSGWVYLPKVNKESGEFSEVRVNEADTSTFDFHGLGQAWQGVCAHDDLQPELLNGNDDCLEIRGVTAPGPKYSFRGYANMGYESILWAERVKKGRHVLLKCTLTVPIPSCICSKTFFTCLPDSYPDEPTSLHKMDDVEVALKKLKERNGDKKRKRRLRMERLMNKYPKAGLTYEKGESSSSEIDDMSDDDMIPPWSR